MAQVAQSEILALAVATLRDDAALLALTGDLNPAAPLGKARVWNHVPQDEVFPYVIVVWEGGREWDTKDSRGYEGLLKLEVVSTHHGDEEVLKITDAVIAAYEANPIQLASGEIVCFQIQTLATPQNVASSHRSTFQYGVLVDADGVGGLPIPPILPGGGDIRSGAARVEPQIISYTAPIPGVKASFQTTMILLPSDMDTFSVTTHFDDVGTPLGIAQTAFITFRLVLGSPFVIVNNTADVRIEATIAATLANLIAALNDPSLVFFGTGISFSNTWTITNPSGTILKGEEDFDGPFPNLRTAFIDGLPPFNFNPDGGAWDGGANGVAEVIVSATVQDFILEIGSTGPTVYFDGNVKDGESAPEIVGASDDPNGVVDDANIIFGSVVSGNQVFRTITIPPVKDEAPLGIATVNWTWKGVPFSAQVEKV